MWRLRVPTYLAGRSNTAEPEEKLAGHICGARIIAAPFMPHEAIEYASTFFVPSYVGLSRGAPGSVHHISDLGKEENRAMGVHTFDYANKTGLAAVLGASCLGTVEKDQVSRTGFSLNLKATFLPNMIQQGCGIVFGRALADDYVAYSGDVLNKGMFFFHSQPK